MSPRRRLSLVSAPLLLAFLLAPAAGARKFQMSGTWVMRNGQVFIPLQFAASAMDSLHRVIHTSMGNLTGAFGFPNGPIPGSGGVTATGSAPATLRIPRHRFVEDAMALVPLNGITLVQISTNFGVDGPFATATLAPGAGPGSFTWCPGNPPCVKGGGMYSTDPPGDGRVIYIAGPNRFGGAMQMGLKRGGDNVFRFNNVPFQVGHNAFGSTPPTRRVAPGSGSPDAPATERLFLRRGVVTQPTMAPPSFNLIEYPGPKLTAMLGLTATMAGPLFYLPTIAVGPMGTKAGQFTTHYGFAQTTGTVIAQQATGTAGQYDFFTFMGSDLRTALGAGNLSLVAGGVSFRNTLAGTTPYATAHKTRLTLAPPIPSLSPGGFAAAGALVLLAAGYALTRRNGTASCARAQTEVSQPGSPTTS